MRGLFPPGCFVAMFKSSTEAAPPVRQACESAVDWEAEKPRTKWSKGT